MEKNAQRENVSKPIKQKRNTFAVLTLVVFLSATSFLTAFDLVPEPLSAQAEKLAKTEVTASSTEAITDAGLPRRIIIESIELDSPVLSPESSEIAVLDQELLRGVVHYPGSGTFNDETNILMFGHSSYLPLIHNKAYKAFNDIQKLEEGAMIKIQTDRFEYVYRVREVTEAKASDVLVEFNTGRKELTLSTCNSFGAKSDRFVVRADFVGKYQL